MKIQKVDTPFAKIIEEVTAIAAWSKCNYSCKPED